MPENEISVVLAAIADLKLDLAVVKTKVGAIEEHLAKLTSQVSGQEREIAEMKVKQAEREAQCPMVDDLQAQIQPLRDFMVSQKAKDESNSTWFNRLSPALWSIAGVLGGIVMAHGKDLLSAVPGK
ncbi:MAG: hypothetical protein J0H49_10590 [Acidobacteria bacterium]|nr:hypothetical protein [Acidobacteriota bacterium]